MSNNKANRTFKEFLWEMLSEKEYISSKRVAGMLMILTALGCTIFLAVREGGSSVVEDLIQTAFIVGSSLLGLASVTSIWKGGRIMAGSSQQETQQQFIEEEPKQKRKKKKESECEEYNEYDSPLREDESDEYSENEENNDNENEGH